MTLAWFKRYEEIGNVTEVCREFGINRKSFYKWWPRYVKEGLSGLRDHSKRPKNRPKTVPKEIQEIVLKLRHESDCGLLRLSFHLEQNYGIKLSVYGICRVLVRAGEIKPRKHPAVSTHRARHARR